MPDAESSRPNQNCTTAEQYQWLLMFRHIPSVYSRLPLPNGTSGQRLGPSRLSKSTRNAPGVKITLVTLAVSAHVAKSNGELTIVTCRQSNGTYLNEATAE